MKPIIQISILASFCLISCNREHSQTRHIRVLFSNGTVFCEGNHVYSSDKGDTIRIGVWKFYYPNGQLESDTEYDKNGKIGVWKFYYPNAQLESETEYDKNGKIVRSNGYSEQGVLIDSYTLKETLTMYSEFYDSGILKRETTIQTNSIGEDDTEEIEYIKEYYSNGHPMEEYQRIDGVREGIAKKWDLSGNLVLEVNYRKGLIQQ